MAKALEKLGVGRGWRIYITHADAMDKAELDADGKIKGLAEQLEALQKSDSYLFDAKESKKQVKGANPGESGNEEGDRGVDVSKMSYSELAAYLAENPDAKID